MTYVLPVLVWCNGLVCGFLLAIVLREYFLKRSSALPEIDAHERDTWPVGRG